ncbi:O-methyltransferase, partial [Streptomyces abikoensis]|uniref:O-methyltransferase n=1 Tax=Streptomyces abikoensis TaxID=97398 RepID=UPI0033D6A888
PPRHISGRPVSGRLRTTLAGRGSFAALRAAQAHARTAWAEAGVADRIDLRIAPALDSLRALPAEPHIDLAFLDANKDGYIAYWEELVPRLRPGGLLIVDNVLFFGTVVDPDVIDGPGAAVREFNAHALADKRMESVMLTVADGVTLARRVG